MRHTERLLLMHQRISKMHGMAHLAFATSEYTHIHRLWHIALYRVYFLHTQREKCFIVCTAAHSAHDARISFHVDKYILDSAESYVNELIVRQRDALITASASHHSLLPCIGCYYYYWQPNPYSFIPKRLYSTPLYKYKVCTLCLHSNSSMFA